MRTSESCHRGDFTASEAEQKDRALEVNREVIGAEVAPITEQFLETFYCSPEFWRATDAAWEKVNKHKGDEFGFGILKDAQSDLTWLTRPQGGKFTNSTDLGDAVELVRNRVAQRGRKPFLFGTMHFHSGLDADRIIVPSTLGGDLGMSASDRDDNRHKTGYDIPLTEMIAAWNPDVNLKMLVYQEPLTYQPRKFPALWEELAASLREEMINDQKEVLELLRHYGYKAEIVESRKSNFTKEELERLKSFAFAPKWVTPAV